MNENRDIWKNKLEQGFADLTPDCWDEIRQAVSHADQVVESSACEVRNKRPAYKRYMPAITAAAVLLLCCFTFILHDAQKVEAMLYLDVNPSVCISINDRGDVVGVSGINDDGQRVIEAVAKETGGSKDLDTVVRGMIAEIYKEGYFGKDPVDVIVSLGYTEKDDRAVLEQACKTINEFAASKALKVNLWSQSFARDKEIEDTAEEIGISAGKYEYLAQLTKTDKTDKDTIRKLAGVPIQKLIHSEDPVVDEEVSEDTADDNTVAEKEPADSGGNEAKDSEDSSINKESSKEKVQKNKKAKKPKKAQKVKNKNSGKDSNNGKSNKEHSQKENNKEKDSKGNSAKDNNSGNSSKDNSKKENNSGKGGKDNSEKENKGKGNDKGNSSSDKDHKSSDAE